MPPSTTRIRERNSEDQALVGIDTNFWIWLAAIAIVAVVTVVVARGRRRERQ